MKLYNRPVKPKDAFSKLKILMVHVKNWHLLFKDKVLGGRNIIYKFRNGIEVECRTKSTDINEAVVVLSGVEYPSELCVFDGKKQAIVFDVGANIGTFSLFVAKQNNQKDIHIYAFEPFPDNAKLCMSNIRRNKFNQFTLSNKAISDREGIVKFDISGGFDAFKINNSSENNIEVKTTTLSLFCAKNYITYIDLLKMDIEGSEFDVIAQDIEFIKSCVNVMFMEYHLSNERKAIDRLIILLQDYFEIILENVHEAGGMLIARRIQD